MARYDGGWPRYVPVDERRRKAEREMEKLRKKGQAVSPIKIEGRAIASTFWGKAWCENLESYHDYENRLSRGRTYVRNGSVVDLQIAPREVRAMVSGSSIYRVGISIGAVAKPQWQSICSDCGNAIDSLVQLLQGKLSKGVMERLCRQDQGLFPKPSDIRFTCSCPDHASMCKHVAAVLYGVGARLDHQPELLFRLRAVDENDLIAHIGTALPMARQRPADGKVLADDDVSALFGLDMAAPEGPAETSAATTPPAKSTHAAGRKISARSAASRAVDPASKPTASVAPKPVKAKSVAAPGTGGARRSSAGEPRPAKPASVVPRAPQPVKWWLRSGKA